MTLAEYSLTAFAVLNGARIAAYVPQIQRICRDQNGAAAVSIVTWMLFAFANAATVAYALLVANDMLVAVIFTLNAIGCLGVAALTAAKRWEQRRRGVFKGHPNGLTAGLVQCRLTVARYLRSE
jgi:uncharacterized protein with PQ loop repeat